MNNMSNRGKTLLFLCILREDRIIVTVAYVTYASQLSCRSTRISNSNVVSVRSAQFLFFSPRDLGNVGILCNRPLKPLLHFHVNLIFATMTPQKFVKLTVKLCFHYLRGEFFGRSISALFKCSWFWPTRNSSAISAKANSDVVAYLRNMAERAERSSDWILAMK